MLPLGTRKTDTGIKGVQNRYKRQIFTAKWQILKPNPSLTRF